MASFMIMASRSMSHGINREQYNPIGARNAYTPHVSGWKAYRSPAVYKCTKLRASDDDDFDVMHAAHRATIASISQHLAPEEVMQNITVTVPMDTGTVELHFDSLDDEILQQLKRQYHLADLVPANSGGTKGGKVDFESGGSGI